MDSEFTDSISEIGKKFPLLELISIDNIDLTDVSIMESFTSLVTQSALVDERLLECATNLRVILKMGRNFYNIDAESVRKRQITFAAVPRKGPNCVAELAITFILSLSKDLMISHRSVAEGTYRLRGLVPEISAQWKMAFHWMRHTTLHEIRGKTLGIVGMGEIGCELALRASIMGMRNIYTKRNPLSDELERHFKAEYRDLNTLLEESDYICLAVPHTAETERMIGKNELARMKSSSYFINICRGGVVDEEALIEALRKQQIAGAGLDVFTYEPLPADSPLCYLDNVILTPHVGGGTGTNRVLELGEALEEMQRILQGEEPIVNLSM